MDTISHVPIIIHTGSDTWTLVAIISGPIVAVLITLWIGAHREKRDSKLRIFGIIMARRASVPLSSEYVAALNLVDVIFASKGRKDRAVRRAWAEYYSELNRKHEEYSTETERKQNALIYAMGAALGFDTKGDPVEKFYIPKGHVDSNAMEWNLRTELLRVLKATGSLNPAIEPPMEPPEVKP